MTTWNITMGSGSYILLTDIGMVCVVQLSLVGYNSGLVRYSRLA